MLDDKQAMFLDTIGNGSRLKIFLALLKSKDELTLYKICRLTGLKRKLVEYHILKLIVGELVLKKVYGQIPLYTINNESREANALIEFLTKTGF